MFVDAQASGSGLGIGIYSNWKEMRACCSSCQAVHYTVVLFGGRISRCAIIVAAVVRVQRSTFNRDVQHLLTRSFHPSQAFSSPYSTCDTPSEIWCCTMTFAVSLRSIVNTSLIVNDASSVAPRISVRAIFPSARGVLYITVRVPAISLRLTQKYLWAPKTRPGGG
jgi:hypothetical protein